MVSTTDFDSVSLGSSPSSPTNLTNMEEIEKINIINKRLRQKEARADWKWVNDGKQFGWARGRSKNRKSKRGYEVGTKESVSRQTSMVCQQCFQTYIRPNRSTKQQNRRGCLFSLY